MPHKYYSDVANEENCLKIKFSVCIDNLEEYFDTSILITLNDLQNFVKRMATSDRELSYLKVFKGKLTNYLK